MAKSYSELEAWGIFVGALVIGVVLTSLFWAFITVPEDVKQIEKEIKNTSKTVTAEKPNDFTTFCEKVDGVAKWDSTGFRQCIIGEYSERSLIVMDILCKKFNLTLTYGSFGVRCDGKS